MHIDFLAIGELLADIITLEYCESLQEARSFGMFQGGSPSNVAANLKWLGKHAEVVSCVGNDGVGKFLLSEIQRIGIAGKYIQVSSEHPTSLVLVTRSKGTPDFIAYRTADRYLQQIDETLIAQSSVLHTTAFALSREPARAVILAAFQKAKSLGKVVSADWNFAPSIWGADNGKAVFEALVQLSPFLKLSLDDLERFWGKASVEEYMQKLENYPCAVTCLTCGGDGVWFRERAGEWRFNPVVPVGKVVDTTGAGDAFWAGFMASYLEGQTVENCVQAALQVAAKKIQQQGPLYLALS